MGATIHAATPGDLEKLIPLLDDEFILGKGRQISLAQRFPAVYCPENVNNIFIAKENDIIISALATKQFTWQDNGEPFHGTMLGAVYTHPHRRKEGLASRLLAWVAEVSRQNGADFAVLWTATPAFYARLSWFSSDCGLLGEAAICANTTDSFDKVETVSANSASSQSIELVRRQWLDSLILRHADDYRQLPLPAGTVNLLRCGENTAKACYALLGCNGDTNIVYEMIGHPDSFHALWRKICSQSKRTIVNDQPGSMSYRWLSQNASVMWQAKPLAMWLPLSAKADMARISRWYIPYFDRI